MNNGSRIIGANQGNRQKNDFYPTPEWATKALLKREEFYGSIWEPACGDGSMSKVIESELNQSIISSDLIDRGYGLLEEIDFLNLPENRFEKNVDNIITNPPYKFAKDFVLQAKKKCNRKIAMLLKLSFLEGKNRFDMFQDYNFPLARVYIFCSRITMFPNGVKTSKASGTIAYAWFVWDRDHIGSPIIKWINDSSQTSSNKN